MAFTSAQDLFALFFAIYFSLIIDRSHAMYKPWDTYQAWRGKPHNIRRLVAAWFILFIIPLLHFSILFAMLGAIEIGFTLTLRNVAALVLIGLGSFFDFGYFRIYEAFLHRYPGAFFTTEDMARILPPDKIRPDFRAHLLPGVLYVVVSTVLILIAFVLLA